MEKVEEKKEKKELKISDVLYSIKTIMFDHHLTIDQAMYLMCRSENIEYNITVADLTSLYNKNLIVKDKVNMTLLFHLKAPKQLSLSMALESVPIGTDISLNIADRIEKEFVIDKYLTVKERKKIADKYFKGDLTVARYFIMFKSLFPVKSKKTNAKWNKKFGFIYDGIGLWDDSLNITKKFHKIFRKLDIGAFLEATYRKVKDSIDFEQERCFMTKPYKFLNAFDSYYSEALERLKSLQLREQKDTDEKINKLKV